jgi:hypothetical protein
VQDSLSYSVVTSSQGIMAAEIISTPDQLEMQTDDVPTSNTRSGTAQQDAGDADTGYVSAQLSDLLLDQVGTFLSDKLMPMAASIEADMNALQYEAQVLDEQCAGDKLQMETELKRLTDIVLNFQAHIAQFLQLGSLQQQ